MDFQRLFLFLIFSFSVLLLWDGWQRSQHPIVQTVPVATSPSSSTTSVTAKDALKIGETAGLVASQQNHLQGQNIKVTTDFLVAEINTVGADLHRLQFLKHRDAKDKSKPFVLLQDRDVANTYIAQTGLLGNELPTHNTLFTVQGGGDVQLAEGENKLQVHFVATTQSGIKVIKTYTFHRGSYVIDIGYEIDNQGLAPISPSAYFQLVRDSNKPEGDSKFVPTYVGPAVYTEQEKFQKVDFSSIEKNKTSYPKTADNGWIAMLQHYFVAAWLPQGNTQREFYTKALDNKLYSAGVILPVSTIDPGKTGSVAISLYAGPAQTSLNKIAPGLGLTVDYGWLTIIATPLFWLLTLLHGWVGNWGVAIILLTVLIKLVFFPLSAASYRSMAKMRLVAPKLEKIKQQYADDREHLHKAMMELYKTEKINPLGGCLPVVIQIPVFISLYWAILSSVELRHAPFFGWINDLSAADPYYVLPLIMGISMFVQTKLNPTPPDPMQAKVMQIMPLVFSVVFFFFPAGLVLYSVVNNVLSITQQWVITRSVEAKPKGVGKA
ncbi:MAG: membrane protein insertase YidC [Sideroxydans sp.]|nr:membrane protein insertase YidC [Sideroxydans sp.]